MARGPEDVGIAILATEGVGRVELEQSRGVGAYVLGASVLPFVWNVFRSYRYGRVVTVAGLWGLATRWSRPPRAELLWENGGRRLRPAPPTAPP